MSGKAPQIPYGAFLDQLEAGNVASVTFEGTEIRGRFKRPAGEVSANGATEADVFNTRLSDFGDPALIAQLRKQRVAIDVTPPSPSNWLLGRVPWPMLMILSVVLFAGIGRLLRGGQPWPGPLGPTMSGHPMIGLLSGLFAKQRSPEPGSEADSERPKSR